MRTHPKDIAQALVEMTGDKTGDRLAEDVDAAILLLKRNNPGKSLRSFPQLVERVLRRKGLLFSATLITPDGDGGPYAKDIGVILKDFFGRDVHMDLQADPSMIGGAVLLVGDERFDMSLRGELERLKSYLTSTSRHLYDFSSSSHESQ